MQKYLPPGVKMPTGEGGKPITLLHLTTHSSGLPRMPSNFAPANPGNPYADYWVRRRCMSICRASSSSVIPVKRVYSNLGVGLLGHVLALHAGKSYEQLLLDRICTPLKMCSTRIVFDDSMRRGWRRTHDADGNRVKSWDIPTFAGTGGIRSTAADMLLYAAAEAEITRTDLTPAMELTQKRQREFGKGNDIGMGWMINQKDGYRWHNGQTGGYRTCVNFDPEKHVAVVLLGTTSSDTMDGVAGRLMHACWVKRSSPPGSVRRCLSIRESSIATSASTRSAPWSGPPS